MTVEFRLGVDKKPAVLKARCNPSVVERREDVREAEEMYPAVANPSMLELRFGVDKNPAVLKPRCNPIVVDKIEEVKEADEM